MAALYQLLLLVVIRKRQGNLCLDYVWLDGGIIEPLPRHKTVRTCKDGSGYFRQESR